MKGYLQHRSRRFDFDGWAARVRGADRPLEWTTCTTRAELRELIAARRDLLPSADFELVKVRVRLEVVDGCS
jgi:hypothetical protein